MLKHFSYILVLFLLNCYTPTTAQSRKILIFSKTAGYHHQSIPEGVAAIRMLGEKHKFTADTTTDARQFNTSNLKNYAAIVFLNTTGDVLNEEEQLAFQSYLKTGGGFAGVHAAADTEYGWPWYGKMIGAYFVSHPKIQEAALTVVNRKTIATKHLPETWKTTDEWYNYKEINPNINILINIEESSYTGGKNGSNHPMAWYHSFEGGRVFYTGLGHVKEAYTDPLYLKHLLGGILYVIGAKSME
jgi:type 1 glutamine amidotransferase